MKDDTPLTARLGEIGLFNFAPYLMNRIMGRYNASLRDEMGDLGLSTPKMRALAVLSVMDGPLIGELAIYAVVEQSTFSRALDQLALHPLRHCRRGTEGRVHLVGAVIGSVEGVGGTWRVDRWDWVSGN